ncbi:MAG TPA: DciA family protein [Actinomycetales bacterium]
MPAEHEPGEQDPGETTPPPDGEPQDEPARAELAARAALMRARAVALSRGLRPGSLVRRRVPPPGAQVSGAAPDDRDPQAFGAGLQRLVAERGWSVDVAVGGVMGRWPAVVGAEVAQHCEPETFEDGVLTVRADSTAWATQVRLLVPTLMRRLAEELGDDVVTTVQVRGPAAPSWKRGSRRVVGRGPRDTYG